MTIKKTYLVLLYGCLDLKAKTIDNLRDGNTHLRSRSRSVSVCSQALKSAAMRMARSKSDGRLAVNSVSPVSPTGLVATLNLFPPTLSPTRSVPLNLYLFHLTFPPDQSVHAPALAMADIHEHTLRREVSELPSRPTQSEPPCEYSKYSFIHCLHVSGRPVASTRLCRAP